MRTVTVHDLRTVLDRDAAVVIDVREPEEFVTGHVPGARLVPLATVPQATPGLPSDQPVYVICQSGQRSAYAAQYLVQRGLDACNVEGGTGDWMAAGFAVER
ncbi:MAG: rhodanese-like domain-containing protein [Actinomycetes bacterium]